MDNSNEVNRTTNELRIISTLLMKISSDIHIIKKKLLLNIEPDGKQLEFLNRSFYDDVAYQNQEVEELYKSLFLSKTP